MEVALVGNSPSTTTAGIMLLTRSAQLGFGLRVVIVGDPGEITSIPGPVVTYAPVLASCGVGRESGSGATVVIPGPPAENLRATLQPHGIGGWFRVCRAGVGFHPGARAYGLLGSGETEDVRNLGRDLRALLGHLGSSTDPAVLDILFGAPVPPLLRLAVALRAGRALTGGRGEPITRYLAGMPIGVRDPLPDTFSGTEAVEMVQNGDHQWILGRFSVAVRDLLEDWLDRFVEFCTSEDDQQLLAQLLIIASHLAQLPQHSILPPLGAAEDSVAVGMSGALRADGEGDAAAQLVQVFRFLGGRYVDSADHALMVSDVKEPESGDLEKNWQWFCQEVRVGRKRADALWTEIFDPAS